MVPQAQFDFLIFPLTLYYTCLFSMLPHGLYNHLLNSYIIVCLSNSIFTKKCNTSLDKSLQAFPSRIFWRFGARHIWKTLPGRSSLSLEHTYLSPLFLSPPPSKPQETKGDNHVLKTDNNKLKDREELLWSSIQEIGAEKGGEKKLKAEQECILMSLHSACVRSWAQPTPARC